MIIGFDIGNTSTTAGVYREDLIIPDFVFNFPTIKDMGARRLYKKVRDLVSAQYPGESFTAFNKLIIASVVPELLHAYRLAAKKYFCAGLYEITCKSRLKVTLGYNNPEQLGVDRIVNAEAAYIEYGGGCIIVDIGTAATFCVLHENGFFEGGLIAPGIGTTIRALAEHASQLPQIVFEKPDRFVAKDTLNAIRSGFFYGWISLIDGIVSKVEKEYGRKYKVILTGGLATSISNHLDTDNTLDTLLTMKGIKYIYDNNR